MDWLKGQTCGMCGHADGEVRQEYRTPNNRVIKDGVSHAHTWTLVSKTCRNEAGECYSPLFYILQHRNRF